MCVIIIHFSPIINDAGAPRDSLSWYNEAPEGGHLQRSEGLQQSAIRRTRKHDAFAETIRGQWRQKRYCPGVLFSFHFIYPGSRVVWGCLPRSRISNTTTRRPMRERGKKYYILNKTVRSHVFYYWQSATPSHLYMTRSTLLSLNGIGSVHPFSSIYVYKVNRMARFSLLKGILKASSSLTQAKSIKMAHVYVKFKTFECKLMLEAAAVLLPIWRAKLKKKKKKTFHGDHLSARNMTAQIRPCVKTSRLDGCYYCWCWRNFDSSSSYYCVVVKLQHRPGGFVWKLSELP